VGSEASLGKHGLPVRPRDVPRGDIEVCLSWRRPSAHRLSDESYVRSRRYLCEGGENLGIDTYREGEELYGRSNMSDEDTDHYYGFEDAGHYNCFEDVGRSYTTTLIRFEMAISDLNIYICVYRYMHVSEPAGFPDNNFDTYDSRVNLGAWRPRDGGGRPIRITRRSRPR
jgi:hypothetical protein